MIWNYWWPFKWFINKIRKLSISYCHTFSTWQAMCQYSNWNSIQRSKEEQTVSGSKNRKIHSILNMGIRFTLCSYIWAMTWQNVSSGVTDQARHKPACAATEISAIESRDIILSKQRITKALIRLCGCAGWSESLLFAYDIRHIFNGPAHIYKLHKVLNKLQTLHIVRRKVFWTNYEYMYLDERF